MLGLPLLNTLFRDLNQFVSELGAPVNKAIRTHLKSFRFNLQTYGGDEAEEDHFEIDAQALQTPDRLNSRPTVNHNLSPLTPALLDFAAGIRK